MKKILTLILLACMVPALCFAANGQKIYSVTDDTYKNISKLAVMSGISIPYSSGPWSEAELLSMLDLVDRSLLGDAGKALYDDVKAKLTAGPELVFDDMGASCDLDITLEGYYNSNTAEFGSESDWAHGYVDRTPLLNFSTEFWSDENFYLFFEVTVKDRIKENIYDGTGPFGAVSPNFTTLIPSYGLFDNFEWQWPQKGLASFGGEHWNLVAGRDRLSWGNGLTGNLMLSDDFPVHTFARFTTFHDQFKYSLLGSVYPYWSTDEHYNPSTGRLNNSGSDASFEGYKSMIVHRLEFKFGKKVNFAVEDSVMFLVKNGQAYNPLLVNVFGFMHNEYIRAYANSLLVFEADYTPIPGLNVYGQFAIDEIQFGESECLGHSNAFILGAKEILALGDGILTINGEVAKTDPYMFLRGSYVEHKAGGIPGTDVVSAPDYGFMALFRSACNQYMENRFITYPYGNDVIVASLKADYDADKFNAGFQGTYIINGVLDAYSNWGMYETDSNGKRDPSIYVQTPTTYNPFDATETGEVEKSLILSLSGSYDIMDNLAIHGFVDFLFAQNHNNVAGNNANDVQISLGVTYSV